ncbi:MAG: hypothetical protein MJA28_06570, partial [Gammaproteobacteria bacterium]|nr:hypothetical protein [Gammaproteobacteria bacterium]
MHKKLPPTFKINDLSYKLTTDSKKQRKKSIVPPNTLLKQLIIKKKKGVLSQNTEPLRLLKRSGIENMLMILMSQNTEPLR